MPHMSTAGSGGGGGGGGGAPAAADDAAACPVCFCFYDTEERRPWSLTCGHSFCEACLSEHPRAFRNCPECRARTGQPHLNIALLRMLRPAAAARGATGRVATQPPVPAGGVMTRRQRQEAASAAAAAAAAAVTVPGGASGGGVQGPAAASRNGGDALAEALTLAGRVPAALRRRGGGVFGHRPEVSAWKASVWLWLGPLLALAYILSPLDLIPDFIPLVGWMDDLLAAGYLAAVLYQRAAAAVAATAPPAAPAPRGWR